MKKFAAKIKHLLEKLTSEPILGALRITSSSIQYVIVKQGKAINFSVPLSPGVIQSGAIQSPEAFTESLQKLHELIPPGKKDRVVKITVSLPATLIYTQSFRVPYINESSLNEAATLNLQMISPINSGDAYMSWQKIGETEDQFELLGAFISKKDLESFRGLLNAARFQPVNFEFPGLGLSRAVSEILGGSDVSYIILDIENDGIDFVLIRNSSMYFDYFIPWSKIQNNSSEITKEIFDSSITNELQKVTNFALSRFKETVNKVVIIAPGLETATEELIKNLGFSTMPFPDIYGLPPLWASAVGSARRSLSSLDGGNYISLGIESAADVFFEERLLNFIHLWRNISIVTLGALVLLHGGIMTSLYLNSKKLSTRVELFKKQPGGNELTNFQEKAGEFNKLVKNIADVRSATINWVDFFTLINGLTSSNGIEIGSLGINNSDRNIRIEASGVSQEAVLRFKNTLVSSPQFENVDLPLSKIGVSPSGAVNFSISFRLNTQP